jgi:hypothetical protein
MAVPKLGETFAQDGDYLKARIHCASFDEVFGCLECCVQVKMG